mgnify:CR=1 FL=1
MQLELLAELHADPLRTQQSEEKLLLGQVGAGRIPEGLAVTHVFLLEDAWHLG